MGFGADLFGVEVVGTLKVGRIDLHLLDERGQLDRVLARHWQRLEILVGDLDVRVLAVLIRLDDLVHEHFAIVDRAPALLLESALTFVVQVVEGEILTFGGPEELDGDDDHPKSNGAFPDRSWHVFSGSGAGECSKPVSQGSRTRRKPTPIKPNDPSASKGVNQADELITGTCTRTPLGCGGGGRPDGST